MSGAEGERLPRRPTRFLPGTPGKKRVLRRRARRGERLWHPLDARMDEPGIVRVPILSKKGFRIVSWKTVAEKELRQSDCSGGNGFDDFC